jgi:hypothetical protein
MPEKKMTLHELLAEQRAEFQMGQEEAARGEFLTSLQRLREILQEKPAPATEKQPSCEHER